MLIQLRSSPDRCTSLYPPRPAKTASNPPSGILLSSLKEMAFDRAVLVYLDTTRSAASAGRGEASNARAANPQAMTAPAIVDFLVPELCLGMRLSRQLCCPICETEFRRHLRSQTEFGNEE